MNEIKSIDARPFPEIWKSLGENSIEQKILRQDLMDDLGCSRQTIDNWVKGIIPINIKTRKRATFLVNKILSLNTHYLTLFPYPKR